MSLTLCVCNCHNSETRGRRLLQRAGVTDYMGVPVYKGRQSVREYLDNNFDDSDVKVREMKAYIANRTKFTILIGYDDNRFEWADSSVNMSDSVRAEAIAQVFA